MSLALYPGVSTEQHAGSRNDRPTYATLALYRCRFTPSIDGDCRPRRASRRMRTFNPSQRQRATAFAWWTRLVGGYFLSACSLIACTVGSIEREQTKGPTVPSLMSISAQAARVGDPLSFGCVGCVHASEGVVELDFNGIYRNDRGEDEAATFKVALRTDGNGNVIWPRFGRYRIPFGSCAEGGTCATGSFEGTVCAANRYFDNNTTTQGSGGQCLQLSLEVLPSIVVRAFFAFSDTQGWRADCRYPAHNALVGASYQLEIEAVGFDPRRFEYVLSEGTRIDQFALLEPHAVSYERTDLLQSPARHALIVKPSPIPGRANNYRMSVDIRGVGDPQIQEGVALSYEFVVRNAVGIYPRPGAHKKVVEIYPPEMTSACLSGNISNNHQSFSESNTFQTQSTISFNLAQNWSNVVGQESQVTIGGSESNSETLGSASEVVATDTRNANQSLSEGRSASSARALSATATLTDAAERYNNTASKLETLHQLETSCFGRDVRDTERGSSQKVDVKVGVQVGSERKASDLTSSTLYSACTDDDRENNPNIPQIPLGTLDSPYANEELEAMITRSLTANRDGNREFAGRNTNSSQSSNEQSDRRSSSMQRDNNVGRSWGQSASLSDANSEHIARTLAQTDSFASAFNQTLSFNQSTGESVLREFSVVESETKTDGVSQEIYALNRGALYEQVQRAVTLFDIVAFDLCGNGTVVGETSITSYLVSKEIAQDVQCPPRTCLLPSQCIHDDYCELEHESLEAQAARRHPWCRQNNLRYRDPADMRVENESQMSLQPGNREGLL